MADVGPLRITSRLTIPPGEIQVRTSRSSGPGGQHANVTDSRVEVVFDVEASATLSEGQKRRISQRAGAVVRAVSQDGRSQARNRELALERLAERLAKALHVDKPRRATRPSRAAKARRVDAKKRTGRRKQERRRPTDDH